MPVEIISFVLSKFAVVRFNEAHGNALFCCNEQKYFVFMLL